MSYLDNIRTFVRVYELGSMSAAGRDLRISPAVTSSRISQLEEHLSVRLFQRTTRSLTPTEQGKAFYGGAAEILESVENAEARVVNITENPKGSLYVAAPLGVGRRLIAPLIAGFLTDYPEVKIRLRLTDRKVDLTTEGLDLGFFLGQPEDSTLRIRKIADVDRVLCASPAYIAARGMPETTADLTSGKHECLNLRFPGAPEFQWRLNTPDGPKRIPIAGRYESDDGDVLTDWALAGNGIAMKPIFEVVEHIKAGRLMPVAISSPPEPIQMACLFTHRRRQDPKTRLFMDYVIERITAAVRDSNFQAQIPPTPNACIKDKPVTQNSNRTPSIRTRVAQALHFIEGETGAVVPAIQPAATYARDENYDIRKPYFYRRDGNQATCHAEAIIAELEGASDSLLFASGMSAATAVIEHLPTGAHVVAPRVMYHGVLHQLQTYARNGRITLGDYTAGDHAELAAAVAAQKTDLVWIETPNNPNWEVTDIAQAAKIAHTAGAKLIADCTGTPPNITRALDFGADISFHSATKYLNGHSDITAGVLSVRKTGDFWDQIILIRKLQGTVLHSFDAWMLIRGMRTLFLRVDKCCQNAMAVAKHFDGHKHIEAVHYPGLPNDPGHEIAKKQTSNQFGGMMSIVIKGTEQNAIDVARFCEIFYPATSLGGVESLIEHRKTVSGEGFPVHHRLLRLSIGIEDADDLIYDLEQAIARAMT